MAQKEQKTQQDVMQENLLREVQEDLQAERLQNLWKKYRFVLFGIVAFIILATVAGELYKSHKLSVRLSESDLYEQAAVLYAQGKTDEAIETYTALATAKTGYKYLADFRMAGIYFDEGKEAEGLKILDTLRQDKNAPENVQAMAALSYVSRQIDTAEADSLKSILNSYMNPASPWYGSAVELSVLLLIKQGQTDAAISLMKEAMAVDKLPAAVREHLKAIYAAVEK